MTTIMHAGAETTQVALDDALPSSHMRGENGHAELTAEGLGDSLLAMFDKKLRSLDEARISSFVADIIAEARTKGDAGLLKNLFVLCRHLTRNAIVARHRTFTGLTLKFASKHTQNKRRLRRRINGQDQILISDGSARAR